MSDLPFWFFSYLHSHSHCLKVTTALCHSDQEHLFFSFISLPKTWAACTSMGLYCPGPWWQWLQQVGECPESFLISSWLSARPQNTQSMRLLKGLMVVHVLWIRGQGEIPIRSFQEVKTTKTTLLASLENQSTLAKGLEQHSVNTKDFSKH